MVDLKDPTLKTFLGPLHRDLHESVYVRPQNLFLSLGDPTQGDFSNKSSLLGCEIRRKGLTKVCSRIDAYVGQTIETQPDRPV